MEGTKILPIPYLQVIVSASTILLIACALNMIYRFGKRKKISVKSVRDSLFKRDPTPAQEMDDESDDDSYGTPNSSLPSTTTMFTLADSPSEIRLNTEESSIDIETTVAVETAVGIETTVGKETTVDIETTVHKETPVAVEPVVDIDVTESDLVHLMDDGHDDSRHDYMIRIGEIFVGRYKVITFIDRGVFGQVVKAEDLFENCFVAIKITKSAKRYIRGAYKEIELLQTLRDADPDNKKAIVKFKDYFKWYNHVCLVFELLACNLLQPVYQDGHFGLSLPEIRNIALQIFTALDFIHSLKIIHCDIKPENVLFTDKTFKKVKLIDFGLSCFFRDDRYVYIQSRYYRAPEVMLGMKYDQPIDIWSLGCLLVELHIGQPLFTGINEVDQMNKIIEVLGIPPTRVLNQSTRIPRYFTKTEGGYDVKKVRNKTYTEPGDRKLQDILGVEFGGPSCRHLGKPGHTIFDYLKYYDLISKMLEYDPEIRITAEAALKHSFFQKNKDEDTCTEIRHANLAAIVPQEPRFGRPLPYYMTNTTKRHRRAPRPPHPSPTNSFNNPITDLLRERDILSKVMEFGPVHRDAPSSGPRHTLQPRVEHTTSRLLLNMRDSPMPTSYIALKKIIPDKLIIRWELKMNKVVICNSRGMALRILDIRNPSLGIPKSILPKFLKFPNSFKHNFFTSPPYSGSNVEYPPKLTLHQRASRSSGTLAIEYKPLKTKNNPDTENPNLPSTSKQSPKAWKY